MTTKQFIAKFISENRNLSIATVDKKETLLFVFFR